MALLPPPGFFSSSTTVALSTLLQPQWQPCFSFPNPSQIKLPSPFFSSRASYPCHFSWWETQLHQHQQKLYCSGSTDSSSATITPAESTQSPGENRTRLIAQNIPWTCSCEDIRSLFQKHGTVVDVELSMYNSTTNRGLAFITMGSEEEASASLNSLNSYELGGRVIKVEFARTLKKKPNTVRADPATKYNVFVGNLTWRVRSRDLREFFGDSNPNVLSAEVIFQSNPRRSAGYGFVSFGSKEDAEAAIAAFNGKKLMGRAIRLVFGKGPSGDSKEEAS